MSIFKRKPTVSFSYTSKDLIVSYNNIDPDKAEVLIQKFLDISHTPLDVDRGACVQINELRALRQYSEEDAEDTMNLYRNLTGDKMTFDEATRAHIQDTVDKSKAMFKDEIVEKAKALGSELHSAVLSNKSPTLSPLTKALDLTYTYVSSHLEKTDTHVSFGSDDVYIVCFCYILGGWKALLSTALPDGMYYEVTYNAQKKETYLDAYKKFENICVPD